jgi:hypothetical protein
MKTKQEIRKRWEEEFLPKIEAEGEKPVAKKNPGTFQQWRAMISRCYNPNDPNYEGERFRITE